MENKKLIAVICKKRDFKNWVLHYHLKGPIKFYNNQRIAVTEKKEYRHVDRPEHAEGIQWDQCILGYYNFDDSDMEKALKAYGVVKLRIAMRKKDNEAEY